MDKRGMTGERYVVKNLREEYANGRRGWTPRRRDAYVFTDDGAKRTAREWAFQHMSSFYTFGEAEEGALRLTRLIRR